MLDLRYGDVERALAFAFDIKDKDIKAFRAKIRHLRRYNVPPLPQTGSGRQITYTLDHVRTLYFGLRLNQIGLDPAAIGDIVKQVNGGPERWFQNAAESPGSSFFVGLSVMSFGGQLGEDFRALYFREGWDADFWNAKALFTQGRRLVPEIVINISLAERLVQQVLTTIGERV